MNRTLTGTRPQANTLVVRSIHRLALMLLLLLPLAALAQWSSLGGVLTSNITAGRNADGRLEVFVRGTDNALWHQWQTAPNGN